jgi:hypothetical protein
MARFSQQVINALANPSYGMLTGQALANTGERLSQVPGNIQAERERQRLLQEQALLRKAGQEGVAAFGSNDSAGLTAAGAQMAALGDPTTGMAFAQAGADASLVQQQAKELAARKVAMATRADDLGLTEVASSVRVAPDNDALNAIAKDLRKTEVERLPSQTPAQRRQMANRVGISNEEFAKAGLGKATDAFFNAYITGEKGKTEAWIDSKGEIKAVRFSNSGKAWDDSKQMFVEPSEMGLTQPAPSVQKVIDVSGKLIEKLNDESVSDLVNFRDKARVAKDTLMLLDRQLARVEGGMPTGIAANISVGLKKVGQLMGMPYDPALISAEEYMMEVATLVKQEIKAFGSGTGLSDKDLDFTRVMVAGDITKQAEALESILKKFREAAIGTLSTYNGLVEQTSKSVGAENMGTFQQITIPEEGLSAEARQYFPTGE